MILTKPTEILVTAKQPRRKTPYVSLNLTEVARDRLQAEQLQIQAVVGKRLSQSQVLLAALAVANAHPAEFATHALDPAGTKDDRSQSNGETSDDD
jgi:CheY-like chemotaxis protein